MWGRRAAVPVSYSEGLFWVCLLAGIYPYLVYPCLAAILARLRSRPVRSAPVLPSVTVVISAYNEVRCIGATVRNKLQQDYPSELLDVLVASDGSTDGTDDVVLELARGDARLRCLRQEPRGGKTAALNALLEQARGDIVVFADANSMYRQDTVRKLVRSFADPDVGYVSGKMIYVNADGSVVGDGCSAYMRYENWLRARETLLGSVVGVDGGVDAVRRSLYRRMRADQLPDFVLPLTIVQSGFRVVFDPDAILEEETLSDQDAEMRMRVRVALRAFWAIRDQRALLNPWRFGVFSWQLLSHKLLRYLSFLPLLAAAALNVLLWDAGVIYRATAVAALVFVGVALLGWGAPGLAGRSRLVRYGYYFVLLNVASAIALVRFVRGEKQVVWQPRVG